MEMDLSDVMVQPEAVEPAALEQPKPAPKPSRQPRKTAANEPPAEESEERTKRITRMTLYFGIFPAKLKPIKPKRDWEKLGDEELERVEKEMDFIMGAKSDVEMTARSLPGIIKAIEDLTAQLSPLRIQGTHAAICSPEGQDLVKCVLIDSGMGGVGGSSWQRLAYLLISTAAQRHAINTAGQLTPAQSQKVAEAAPTDPIYADL